MEHQEKARAIVEAIYRGEIEDRWFKTLVLEAFIEISLGGWIDRERLFFLIEQKLRISREVRAQMTRPALNKAWDEKNAPVRRHMKSPQEALQL